MDTIFAWQCHLGRCGGDGRRLQAHEAVKMTMRELVLSNAKPGGAAFPASSILIELPHLRSGRSRPGDIMAMGKDRRSVLKAAERTKFGKDVRLVYPIASSSTMRFVPLAPNHLGLWGPHFQAVLKEFASILVTKPEGCSLLRGPFALTHTATIQMIMRTWGARITWTAKREHAGQILRGM